MLETSNPLHMNEPIITMKMFPPSPASKSIVLRKVPEPVTLTLAVPGPKYIIG